MKTLAAALALAVLAGCSGAAIAPFSNGGATATTGRAANHRKGQLRLAIRVPKRAKRRPRYVSPATQSMKVLVLQGSSTVLNQTVNLTVSSTGCTSTLAGVECSLSLSLPAGSYSASVVTFDGTNATGNVLSTAQSVAFTIIAGQTNAISMTLSGVPAEIFVSSAGGNGVYVLAQDADGDFIVGSGAPSFTAAKTAGTSVATITQPTSARPNLIGFASNGTAGSETIGVTASYPAGQADGCALPGAVCTASSAVTATYGRRLFVANPPLSTVLGYSIPFTGAAQSPAVSIGNLVQPYALALDGSDDVFAASDANPGNFYEITSPYALPPVEQSGVVNAAYGAIVDPSGNAYVANLGASNVLIFAPPYTNAPTTLSNGLTNPCAVATDGTYLYVADNGTTIEAYLLSNILTNPAPSFTLTTASVNLALRFTDGNLYVGESSDVQVFDGPLTASKSADVTLTNTTQGIFGANGLAVDTSGDLFVANTFAGAGSAGTLQEYQAPFTSSSLAVGTVAYSKSGMNVYEPHVITVVSGNLYVADGAGGTSGGGGLQEFATSGTTLTNASAPSVTIVSQIDQPSALAVSNTNYFVVTP